MSKRKFKGFSNGKGYYIALILCAVAIGISGYLYYSYQDGGEPQAGNPDVSAVATNPGDDVQAGATQPGTEGTEGNGPTQPSTPVTRKPLQTVMPVEGEIVGVYAMDSLSYNPTTRDWRVHNGVDIAAEEGTKVVSAAAGTVYTVYADETLGTTVVIRHDDGYTTQYACLAEEVSVKAGDAVTMGQQIGCVGQTALLESAIGHHVHFSVSCEDTPMDPADFLSQE
ncbi:MAG: M23 family metallopeptidase [Oscillospiraceae bacterium]|nr:M23 family metallopeptidase [Oscillospiraceae bacterium]